MNTRFLRLIACVVWTCAVASSAAPVNALAITSQVGEFASCSVNYSNFFKQHCGGNGDPYLAETYYTQTIKFVSSTCNSGGCAALGSVQTDIIYGAGRKTASGYPECVASIFWYQLGTCAC
jgi:hypothetical protein